MSTADDTDDILAADANGVLQRSKINYGGRWTNTDVVTNLNITSVIAPIFGTQDYKDDGNIVYQVIGNTLRVNIAGRYDIRANLSLLGIDSSGNTERRTNVNARIAVNRTVPPIPIYLLASDGHFFNILWSTPAQNHRKFWILCIRFPFYYERKHRPVNIFSGENIKATIIIKLCEY